MTRPLLDSDADKPISQARHWCFTWNNPPSGTMDWSEHKTVRYAVYQKEEGENGTPHFQGYVEFTRPTRLGALKKILPQAHWEPRRGTREEARNYCMKEDSRKDGPWEYGQFETSQGKRNDLEEVQEKIKSGATMKRIADEHFGSWCRYNKAFKTYKEMCVTDTPQFKLEDFNGPTLDLRKPCILNGGTGLGKTQFAKAHFKNPLLVSHIDDLQTLDEDHDGIVFDDISFSHWPATAVIHLVDIEERRSIHNRYTNSSIPKGMRRIFTYNGPIEEWLIPPTANEQQIQAINRRINVYNVTESLIKSPQ